MRRVGKIGAFGTLVTACCVAAVVFAQQRKISNDEVMRVLDEANRRAQASGEGVSQAQPAGEAAAVAAAGEASDGAADAAVAAEEASEGAADAAVAAEEASEGAADAALAAGEVAEDAAVAAAEEASEKGASLAGADAESGSAASEAGEQSDADAESAALAAADEEEMATEAGLEFGENVSASRSGDLISIRLKKTSLETAINVFAQLAGVNIIVPQLDESAQLSLNLKDVEWRPALQSILDTYNYELYQRVPGSNVYSVRSRPAGAPEPQVVETFTLKYATVPNAAKLVHDLLPPSATVTEFASRNMLVVRSTESSLGEVRKVLKAIDTVRRQVYIESKFMELADGAQKDLGLDWSVMQSYGVGSDGKAITYDSAKQLLDKTALQAPALVAPELGGGEGAVHLMTSVLDADQFRVILSALEQNKDVNVVSNPKIIVANEEPATISIITKEPNLKQDRQQALNDQPDTITYMLDPDLPFFEYGIKLGVTPSINTSSNITVKIVPELTRKTGEKRDRASENDLISYPIMDVKKVETVFNLADGQTAAIGGLTEAADGEEEKKVPYVSAIPYFGELFKWKQTTHSQKETIIFVTVGLADTQDITEENGLPKDSELARRRFIKDRADAKIREQGRIYYQAQQDARVAEKMSEMQEDSGVEEATEAQEEPVVEEAAEAQEEPVAEEATEAQEDSVVE